MTHTSFRALSVATLLVAGSVVTGCKSGAEPSDPHDQLAETQSASSHPTGSISATTMKSLASFYASIQAATPVFNAMGSINTQNSSCISGQTVDLACATKGSPNALTGSVDFQAEIQTSSSGQTITAIFNLHNVCANGVCIDGDMGMETVQSGMTQNITEAFAADVTQNGAKKHVYFGEQLNHSASSVESKTVIFDSTGASYVIDVSTGATSAMYSIVGANGSFQCSISPQGGQCSGAASFSY